MSYKMLKNCSCKEYLGYCELKGFIYSVQLTKQMYAVVALKDAKVNVLIRYRVSKLY